MQPQVDIAPLKTDSEIDIVHIQCCRDQNISLCGLDLTGATPGDTPECVDCAIAENREHCPKFYRCINSQYSFIDG